MMWTGDVYRSEDAPEFGGPQCSDFGPRHRGRRLGRVNARVPAESRVVAGVRSFLTIEKNIIKLNISMDDTPTVNMR